MASWIRSGSEKRSGSASISSSGGMPVLNETYSFIIESDTKFASRIEILYGTPNFPKVNQTVSAYGLAVCKGVTANRREDNPFLWDATATFSSEVDEGQDNQDPQTDPTDWVPVYETKFERLQEVVTEDQNGDPVANSAGQPFATGLTVGRFIPMWEFFQFEPATVDDETLIARNECVNNATFKGKPQKSLLLTILSSKVSFYYGQRRRLTQYCIRYNSRLWTHKRLDVGTVFKDGTQIKPYKDSLNQTVILGGLNGAGAKVAAGDPPATLQFDIYPSISFSFLRV